MRTLLPILLLTLSAPLSAALAKPPAEPPAADADAEAVVAPIVMSSGAEGGGYWGVGTRLAQAATRYKAVVDVRPSSGSIENLQRLNDSDDPTAVGLTQADALAVFLTREPGFAARFEVLESIGKECVFIIAAADSGIDRFTDLRGNIRMAMRSATSGIAVTFAALQSMQAHLADVQPVYMDPDEAMAELAKPPGEGRVDALMLVHRPKLRSEVLNQALFEQDRFHLVPIEDQTLDAKLPNGRPVYTAMNLPLVREKGWNAKVSLKTVCTEGLLLTAPGKLNPEQSRALQQVVDYDWMRVYVQPEP